MCLLPSSSKGGGRGLFGAVHFWLDAIAFESGQLAEMMGNLQLKYHANPNACRSRWIDAIAFGSDQLAEVMGNSQKKYHANPNALNLRKSEESAAFAANGVDQRHGEQDIRLKHVEPRGTCGAAIWPALPPGLDQPQ